MTELTKISKDIETIKSTIIRMDRYGITIGDYIPEKLVGSFFSYSDTKLREFRNENKVIYSKIGKRFFYSKESIIKLLNNNIINSDGKSCKD